MLEFMGLQRDGHNLVTEQQQILIIYNTGITELLLGKCVGTLAYVNKIIPLWAVVLFTDDIKVYTEIHLSPLTVLKYTIIHLLRWHFSAWHLILSQTDKQSYWALPRISKAVSPGRDILIKVWLNENYESYTHKKNLLQVILSIQTWNKSRKVSSESFRSSLSLL